MNPQRWNILILLTSKAIYPAAMDALYWYMPSFVLDLTLQSAARFLLNVISPYLLRRIEQLTLTWKAFRRPRRRYIQAWDGKWFVWQVLIGKMMPEKGGRLGTVGISMLDRILFDNRARMWSLAEQVIKGFVKGRFERVQIELPSYFLIEVRPHVWLKARWRLYRIVLGARRAWVVESRCWDYVAQYDRQIGQLSAGSRAEALHYTATAIHRTTQNAFAEVGVFMEDERRFGDAAFGNVLVLGRLPAAPNSPS